MILSLEKSSLSRGHTKTYQETAIATVSLRDVFQGFKKEEFQGFQRQLEGYFL